LGENADDIHQDEADLECPQVEKYTILCSHFHGHFWEEDIDLRQEGTGREENELLISYPYPLKHSCVLAIVSNNHDHAEIPLRRLKRAI
jgi:hypothetical protein